MSVGRPAVVVCVGAMLLAVGGLSAGPAVSPAAAQTTAQPAATESAASADPAPGSSSYRLLGSYGVETFGYEDAANADHLCVEQIGRLSLVRTGARWSLHGTVSHLSHFDDELCRDDRTRFLKGFFRYGGFGTRVDLRAGRFFLHRGVAVGVFDGADLLVRPGRRVRLGFFAGLAGPRSREFELEDPDDAFSFGAEAKFAPRRVVLSAVHDLGCSYVRQRREEGVVRHLVGVSTRSRWGRSLTWLNVAHLRPQGEAFRKLVSRARYRDGGWGALAELAVLRPVLNEYTWFNDFGVSSSVRTRLGLDRHFGETRWAFGFEGAVLSAGGENGFRGGPVFTSPWGSLGYRTSSGGQAQASGPWVTLHAAPGRGLTLHAYGSVTTYEWDAFELDTGELVTVRVGGRYTPPQFSSLTIRGEFQVYRTPEFEQDRRALVGLTWRFDTAGGTRAGGTR